MNLNLRVMCKINNLQEVEAEYINKQARGVGKRWKMKRKWGWLFGVRLSECRFCDYYQQLQPQYTAKIFLLLSKIALWWAKQC